MAKKPYKNRFLESDVNKWQQCADKETGGNRTEWMEKVLNKAAERKLSHKQRK